MSWQTAADCKLEFNLLVVSTGLLMRHLLTRTRRAKLIEIKNILLVLLQNLFAVAPVFALSRCPRAQAHELDPGRARDALLLRHDQERRQLRRRRRRQRAARRVLSDFVDCARLQSPRVDQDGARGARRFVSRIDDCTAHQIRCTSAHALTVRNRCTHLHNAINCVHMQPHPLYLP